MAPVKVVGIVKLRRGTGRGPREAERSSGRPENSAGQRSCSSQTGSATNPHS